MSCSKYGVRFALAALVGSLLSIPSFADSQARIVRLSDVQGTVQIDRNTGQGYEKASINLPITQGVKLHVDEDSFAIVEFEDGTALRLTPLTVVTFPQLSLRDSGAKATRVELQRGTAYVSYVGTKDDEFALNFGSESVKLEKAARIRVEMDQAQATLAVLKGEAQVVDPAGVAQLGKKQTISFDLAGRSPYTIAKNVDGAPFDEWDKHQEEYTERYAKSAYSSGSSYRYGSNDLAYYGSFTNVAGYGMMWQPFLTGAGWDPFMNGTWAYYPGSGYGWASAYPWGWLPYHSGSWMFIQGNGWMWQPGGSWAGLNNMPVAGNVPRGFVTPRPPVTPTPSLIAVNRSSSLAAVPTASSMNHFVIRNGTAGIGIPRGSIQNLGKISQQAQQNGFATTKIQPQVVNPAMMRIPMNAQNPNGGAQPAQRGAQQTPTRTSTQRAPASAPQSAPASRQPSYSAPRSAPMQFPSGGMGGGAPRGGGGTPRGR